MTIDEPRSLKRRPHFKGMPVPITVTWVNGHPDFTAIDWPAAHRLAAQRDCALCGDKMLGSRFAFIGGPAATEARVFVDGPMHEDCARYAIVVCPFVAGRKDEYRAGANRTYGMALTIASAYKVIKVGGGPTVNVVVTQLAVEPIDNPKDIANGS